MKMPQRALAFLMALILLVGASPLTMNAYAADSPFGDVSPKDWFYSSVMWAVENGITGGLGNGNFGPNDPCNRAQVVTFLWAANGKPEPKTTVNPFIDIKATDWYYKPVLWAVEEGITTGTSPITFYQIWAFIAPGLYKEEKRAVLPLAFFSSVFFIAGAAFCFFMVFPIAFKFFMGFATDTIVPMISVEEYLGFALKLLIAFGVVFEMPLFAYFLSRFGILSPDFMRRQRRYAILFIFIIAAILTPPDVFSQCLMALPMLLLYEVSIYVSAIAYPKKKKEDKADDTEEESDENTEEQA